MNDLGDLSADLEATGSRLERYVRLLKSLRGLMHDRHLEATASREAREILGIDPDDPAAYRHQSKHSRFPGRHHPDNRDALATVASYDLHLASSAQGSIESVEEGTLSVPLEQSMILVGSPTAEGLSRDIFGYEPVEGSDNGLRLVNPPLELPLSWVLDPSEINPGATATRFVRGEGRVSRPNWGVEENPPGEKPKRHFPRVGNDGFLGTDFLIVTRFPNFLTGAAYGMGRYIVSIGGAHGMATRAVELLLSDASLLSRIASELKSDQSAYQLLLEVGKPTHDEAEGTRATRIKLRRVYPLDDYEERWVEARRAVQPALARRLIEET